MVTVSGILHSCNALKVRKDQTQVRSGRLGRVLNKMTEVLEEVIDC
jgi:hypothetical protein